MRVNVRGAAAAAAALAGKRAAAVVTTMAAAFLLTGPAGAQAPAAPAPTAAPAASAPPAPPADTATRPGEPVAAPKTPISMGDAKVRPLLSRIRIATIAAADIGEIEARYTKWLGYVVRERGKVPASLAASWGAPKAAGRPYVLMSSPGWPDVYIRAVQTPAVKGYEPMTTWGWNAIEIVVDDPDATRAKFREAPFTVIGEPENLQGYPSIRAFQVTGSAQEVLYLTAETGDRTKSPLPSPNGAVGRPFIMVVAGPDIEKLRSFYGDNLHITSAPARERTLGLLQKAQHLAPDSLLPITTGRLAMPGNLLEFDGYSAKTTARPHPKGELPPGVAMTSFGVVNLDDIDLPFVKKPMTEKSRAYGGKRTATVVGPAGELIELIEE